MYLHTRRNQNFILDLVYQRNTGRLKQKQLKLMALKISDEAAVQMPMKTVASLIALVAIGTWAYFGIIETQNKALNRLELMEKDLIENTAFRIGWPRGTLGSLPR